MHFTGRLTADAEVGNIKGGQRSAHFTVAVSQQCKTESGIEKKTALIDCTYRIAAKLAGYLRRDTLLDIDGWVEAEAWKDWTGVAHPRLVCQVHSIVLFLPAVPGGTAEQVWLERPFPDEDDLPF